MAQHQISASQIRPGSTIILRGKIEYARVRSLMGPEDIDKLNETRRANRKPGAPFYPLDRNKPLTRLSLSNDCLVRAYRESGTNVHRRSTLPDQVGHRDS